MKTFIKFIIIFLPWKIKRIILQKFFNYNIHPNARIGFSFIYPQYLEMKEGSIIGDFNVAIHLDKMIIGEKSTIGRKNWITGFPTKTKSKHFAHQRERQSQLIIGKESAITKNHHIDCTNSIIIGDFVTIAGYYTQMLTHSIDLKENRQNSLPIIIEDYCFISTRCILLGGSKLPNHSTLAAGAVLNKNYSESWTLYAGVPAKPIKAIEKTEKYFTRQSGFVY